MRESLASLAKIHYGKSPSEVALIDGTVPVVGTGGIYGHADRAMFGEGIVVARKGSLGKPHLFRTPFWPVDTTYAVVPLAGISIEWLYYCLVDFDLSKLNEATGVPSISRNWLAKIGIENPGAPRQKRIAAVLTGIDTAIEKTETLIAKFQKVKAGLMHDLFTRGVLPNGQLRPPREQAPELYQETAIGWLPKDWKLVSLRSCLRENPTNGIYKSADMIGDGTLMVGQTAFTSERSVDFSLCRRGLIGDGELRNYGLAQDDILVTRVFATVQGVGLPTLVPTLTEPAVFESNMMRLKADLATSLPRFLFEWLRGQRARRFIHGGANASNQASVNQSVLNPLPVPRPDLDEQIRVVAKINAVDQRLSKERATLSKLQDQKLGLMQDLLTGRVPVKVDEPVVEPFDA
jgi:type I restriction enzyme S subunit